MNADLQQLLAFHLTGEKLTDSSNDADHSSLHPALLSKYRDLSRIRYDYPLVLLDRDSDLFVKSLSAVANGVLQGVAPKGLEGERLRRNVLGLESEIRRLVASGEEGSLSQLWDRATENLLSNANHADEDGKILRDNLQRARAGAGVDGRLIDCDAETPNSLFVHAWNAVERKRNRRVSAAIDELIIKLSDILKADFMKSDEARSPEALRSTIGKGYQDELNFEALSNVLTGTFPADPMPEKRRERLRFALSALESQRFFSPVGGRKQEDNVTQPHSFLFDSCATALAAFQDRLAEMATFVKAVRIAELEIDNQYKEAKHDRFFAQFAGDSLTAEDIGIFPSYLICLDARECDDTDRAKLMQILLSSDLPMKVLVQTDDVLEGYSVVQNGTRSFGGWNLQLATMAAGLQSAYVLQSTSSNLYQMTDGILAGLEYPGPALFSVFSARATGSSHLPPYLVSASAMQSRAFPAFTYDPSAGDDWASRFSIAGNPQAEATWPVERLSYEDKDLQRVSEDVAFTFVDFAACDERYAKFFMKVPRGRWHDAMIPAKEYLELREGHARDKIPYILMVDEQGFLQRVVVADRLLRAARRCAKMWRNLEELGGINNSHARRLLEKERTAWEEQKQSEIEELKSQLQRDTGSTDVAEASAAAVEEARGEAEQIGEERAIEEPYIETPRCTTCNECTNKNNKIFAYNDNKQAYMKDPTAGTYRDLVEAAEKCQVCIIHPGKPKNPDEPNLEELIKRAEPFNQPRARRTG